MRRRHTVPRRTDAPSAAQIADLYAETYVSFRRTQAVNQLVEASEQIAGKIAELQTEIDRLEEDLANAESEVEAQTVSASRDRLIAQQAVFRQTLDELQVDAALRTGGVSLVARSEIPVDPVRPKRVQRDVEAMDSC